MLYKWIISIFKKLFLIVLCEEIFNKCIYTITIKVIKKSRFLGSRTILNYKLKIVFSSCIMYVEIFNKYIYITIKS